MEHQSDGHPVRRLSRLDVYDHLHQRLVHGEWTPGQIVQEQTLAAELRVSKTPVREALQLLALQGMVRAVVRVGYVVSEITLADMVEVFQFRILLEKDLMAQLANVPVPSLSQESRDPSEGPQSHAVDPEIAFHHGLYGSIVQPRKRAALGVLVDQTARAMGSLALDPAVMSALNEEHRQIFVAVELRDFELAGSLMVVHLSHLRDAVLSKLRQHLREQENFL